ncbi:hypothetical protein CPAR01_05596 [Colletotrichum paranaense]|uniref:Uncharacterized protein n=1 Tax=Colletotrichum paranaense TaxID=1914294 RepID=A0ABQ9SRR8_9PEZI|nr:uncharacterized protein CPAR01_05596 [Colletotrichum paranaense]KAK1542209.1 hypothetical protein CPAR01_05596 [Colletotrichum paranaense]
MSVAAGLHHHAELVMQGVQQALAYIVLTTWDHDRGPGTFRSRYPNARDVAPELNTGETGFPVVQLPGRHDGAAPPNGVHLLADICSSETFTLSVQAISVA